MLSTRPCVCACAVLSLAAVVLFGTSPRAAQPAKLGSSAGSER